MTASLQAKVPAERPVHPLTIELLADVARACETLGTQFVLTGASACDIQLWHLHGIKAPVTTRDVDVAVCALSWEFHHRLVDTLLASGNFQRDPKAQQKLLFQRETDAFGVELDLVAFGSLEARYVAASSRTAGRSLQRREGDAHLEPPKATSSHRWIPSHAVG